MQPLPLFPEHPKLMLILIKRPTSLHATVSMTTLSPDALMPPSDQKLNSPLLRFPSGYTIIALRNKPTVIPIATWIMLYPTLSTTEFRSEGLVTATYGVHIVSVSVLDLNANQYSFLRPMSYLSAFKQQGRRARQYEDVKKPPNQEAAANYCRYHSCSDLMNRATLTLPAVPLTLDVPFA